MLQPKGVIPALVTPLDEHENVDTEALRRVVRHVLAGGVHAIFTLGTQGEFYALSQTEKQQVLEIVIDETAGRVPVYAGTGAITTRDAIDLTAMAKETGAAAASVITPYFVHPTQDELYEHYASIAHNVDLPVLLYTNPGFTGVTLEPETVTRLAAIDSIIGIKDSTGDIERIRAYVEGTPESFATFVGNDSLIFQALGAGAVGAIAATANVVPDLVVSLFNNWVVGDTTKALEAQWQINDLRDTFALGTFPVVAKEYMALLGLCGRKTRKPVAQLSVEDRETLRAELNKLGR